MYSNFKLSKFKLDGKNLRIVYISVKAITETRPFKNVDRENANKWKMTSI